MQVFGRNEIEKLVGVAVAVIRVLARQVALHIVELADHGLHVHAFQAVAGYQRPEAVGREMRDMFPVEGGRLLADQPGSHAFHIRHHNEQQAAWLEHALDLGDDTLQVEQVFQHVPQADAVVVRAQPLPVETLEARLNVLDAFGFLINVGIAAVGIDPDAGAPSILQRHFEEHACAAADVHNAILSRRVQLTDQVKSVLVFDTVDVLLDGLGVDVGGGLVVGVEFASLFKGDARMLIAVRALLAAPYIQAHASEEEAALGAAANRTGVHVLPEISQALEAFPPTITDDLGMLADHPAVSRFAFPDAVGFFVELLGTETQIAVKLVLCLETAFEGLDVECLAPHSTVFLLLLSDELLLYC